MNQADTAWMLCSTALVLFMTPMLAFFYGGLVRSKNALNTMMMSFIALGFTGINAAVAVALALGSRREYPSSSLLPHSVPLTLLGAGGLWFGWFGFNSGSALASNGIAALAFTATFLAPAATLVVWTFLDYIRSGKP